MYGGTTRGRLSALALTLTVAVLVAGTGCQDQTAGDTSRATRHVYEGEQITVTSFG